MTENKAAPLPFTSPGGETTPLSEDPITTPKDQHNKNGCVLTGLSRAEITNATEGKPTKFSKPNVHYTCIYYTHVAVLA